MPNDDQENDVSRRGFLDRMGAGAILGATGVGKKRTPKAKSHSANAPQAPPALAWTSPQVLKNPNILVVLVDQMRLPSTQYWLTPAQLTMLSQTVTPNIMGILNNSYNFGEYFVAATMCTASRSTMLTGLYAPQTAVYVNGDQALSPPLNPAFPTWGEALATLNPAYKGNVWWFGKWHLSQVLSSGPLVPYGFNTRTYPGGLGPNYNPSPDGAPNTGSDGGLLNGETWANDSMVAGDFIGWLEGQSPSPGVPGAPWCATVSLLNPHDIAYAPAWVNPSSYPPSSVPTPQVYFPPPPGIGTPLAFYSAQPAGWNYEGNLAAVNKPALQTTYQTGENGLEGLVAPNGWVLFLNQYFFLQNLVDQQVGRILAALNGSPYANNTVILFTSDHGEYAGSHGLHGKGFACYDESIRVPFSIQFPGQSGSIAMNQMCSSVDFFGLICDLATGGSGQWRLLYPDLANRQSMWSFLYANTNETRVAASLGSGGLPYILHTFDDTKITSVKPHMVCLRTKHDPNNGVIGAKLALYSFWAACTTYPNATPPDPEFYDYSTGNTIEVGNDYFTGGPATQTTITQYKAALGSWGATSTGIIGSELNAPLVGKDAKGNPLTIAQTTAQLAYYAFMGNGTCTG